MGILLVARVSPPEFPKRRWGHPRYSDVLSRYSCSLQLATANDQPLTSVGSMVAPTHVLFALVGGFPFFRNNHAVKRIEAE